MAQTFFERMGGTYHREGDYLIPNLTAPESPHIGVWGERRRQYLLKNRDGIYTGMLLSGTLNAHLEEIDRTANEMLSRIIEGMARRETLHSPAGPAAHCSSYARLGITEALKAENQMEWVQRMNAIRAAAEEVVRSELIYC